MLQISVHPRLGGPIQCLSLDTLLCKLALTIVRHPHPNVQVCNWGGQWRQKNFSSLRLWRGTFVAMFANSYFTRQLRELAPTSSVNSLLEIRQGEH